MVEREIALESVAPVDVITAISHHLQGNGGKRLRPMLVLLAAKLCGGTNESAVRMGAVVEMVHSATLIHDDVIDDSRTRRGKPSANVLWSNQTCVLAGDWLYMQAFQIALRERNFAVLDILISLTQKMVQGELIQLDRIGRIDVSEAEYRELVDRKTANPKPSKPTSANMPGTSVWPSSWWTMYSISPLANRSWASRLVTTCAKEKSPCR
jgi:octaprenyl-diphosphate synthase